MHKQLFIDVLKQLFWKLWKASVVGIYRLQTWNLIEGTLMQIPEFALYMCVRIKVIP